MGFIVVIPSRYASTRLPGKPLLDIAGKTMIQRVWEQALQSDAEDVYIATDYQEIKAVAEGFGAKVCMTSDKHESGTDRLQEVVAQLKCADDQIIVNVQGDEPLIPPEVINQVAELMTDPEAKMATLYEVIEDSAQVFDPNVVKLVTDDEGKALYFSRAPIPWNRDDFANGQNQISKETIYKRHIGIYGYRTDLLNNFVKWPMTELESIEKLEQLRAMSHGVSIRAAEACDTIPAGVDTQADLDLVRSILS